MTADLQRSPESGALFSSMDAGRHGEVFDAGLQAYAQTLELQRRLHAEVASGERGPTLIVVEHPPVITLGRNAQREHVLESAEALRAQGIDVVEIERGGDVTYHGPGQLVVYPIVRLERFREIVPVVSAIERAVIEALGDFGIASSRNEHHRGVYVGDDAICAVGLAVRKMTTMHGLALNVSTALDYDRLILPCGTPEFGITSMSALLGRTVSLDEVKGRLLRELQVALQTPAAAALSQ